MYNRSCWVSDADLIFFCLQAIEQRAVWVAKMRGLAKKDELFKLDENVLAGHKKPQTQPNNPGSFYPNIFSMRLLRSWTLRNGDIPASIGVVCGPEIFIIRPNQNPLAAKYACMCYLRFSHQSGSFFVSTTLADRKDLRKRTAKMNQTYDLNLTA